MAKAPLPGRAKTRLVPPLSPEAAAALSAAFLRDVGANLTLAATARADPRRLRLRARRRRGGAARRCCRSGGFLVLADGSDGDRPLACRASAAACCTPSAPCWRRWLAASACSIPTARPLPTALLRQAAAALAAPGERVVLGPAEDGGYYLIGMKSRASDPVRGHRLEHRSGRGPDPRAGTAGRARSGRIGTLVRRGRPRLAAAGCWTSLAPARRARRGLAPFGRAGHRCATARGSRHCLRAGAARAPHDEVAGRHSARCCWPAWRAGLALHIPGAGERRLDRAHQCLRRACSRSRPPPILPPSRWFCAAQPPRGAVWLVLGVALAMRLPVLFAPPFLSSDVFRYVWDGKVQNAGIDPYRFVPADPALARLRDTAIYPRVNRAEIARTIYPPFAEAVFALVARVSRHRVRDEGGDGRLRAGGDGSPGAAARPGAAAARAAADLRLEPARGLEPCRQRPCRCDRGRDGGTGAAGGGAAMAAGWPARCSGPRCWRSSCPPRSLPALWRRWDWRLPAACAVVIVALYALYLLGAGGHVLGYLSGYASEEGFAQGGGIWALAGLAEFGPLPPGAGLAYAGLVAVALLALAARLGLARRPADPAQRRRAHGTRRARSSPPRRLPRSARTIRGILYGSRYRAASVRSARSYGSRWPPLLLYLDPLHERFVWPALLYVPAIGLALLDLRAARAERTGAAIAVLGRSS